MIEIIKADIESKFELSPDYVNILICENPREFYKSVNMLYSQFVGDEGEFVFIKENERFNPAKRGDILVDLFNFDFNDKKIINLLYKELEKNYNNGEFICKLNQINADTERFLQALFLTTDISLSYQEIQIVDLLKAYAVKIEKNYESFLEKIICYVNLLVELKKVEFICFVNLKSVLSNEDLLLLYDHCKKEKISLFLLESAKVRALLPMEKAVIITEDLCEIVENFNN